MNKPDHSHLDPLRNYRNASFVTSVNSLKQLPQDNLVEVAFAGRSNAGKSSAINTLTDNKNLCRTSKTPGRTQMINYFQLDEERFLVDLPGYGYAKVSGDTRRHWQKLLSLYLEKRLSLKGMFIIMDIRHPMTPVDKPLVEWCNQSGMPLHILLTKADKLTRGAAKNTLLQVRKQLAKSCPAASVQVFSASDKTGLDEAVNVLNSWFGFEQAET